MGHVFGPRGLQTCAPESGLQLHVPGNGSHMNVLELYVSHAVHSGLFTQP